MAIWFLRFFFYFMVKFSKKIQNIKFYLKCNIFLKIYSQIIQNTFNITNKVLSDVRFDILTSDDRFHEEFYTMKTDILDILKLKIKHIV